jgi:MFS family permease
MLTVGLIATITLLAFEALALSTVMPLVARDLGDLSLYGWAFSGFFLGNLVGIVAAGMAIDRVGLRTPFIAGLVLFTIGLLVGGLATSMPVLVMARIVQGLGAGAIPAVAYVSIRERYPEQIRPTMFALLSTAWVVPGLVGPLIAGWIGDHSSWRFVFLGLLPLILVSGALTLLALRSSNVGGHGEEASPQPAGPQPAGPRPDRGADTVRLVYAVLVAVGAGLVLIAPATPDPLIGVGLVVAGVALGLPPLARLLPPGTLRGRPGIPATVLVRGLLTFAFFGADAYLPLALINVRDTSATEAGLIITSATLTWTAGSWIQAARNAAWGTARLVRLGYVAVLVGVATTTVVLLPNVSFLVAVLTWGIAGLGMGLAYSSLSLLVLRDAPEGEAGSATAALQLSDVLGTSLGTGLGAGLVAFAVAVGSTVAAGIALSYLVSGLVAAAGLLVSRRLR